MLLVNCREDAGTMKERVPYGIAVTLEVAKGSTIPIYDEIRARMYVPIPITTSQA